MDDYYLYATDPDAKVLHIPWVFVSYTIPLAYAHKGGGGLSKRAVGEFTPFVRH